MNPNDILFLQHALELAKYAQALDEVPIGAIIVKDDQIIGKGWNHLIGRCDPTSHAEIMALREAAQTIGNYRLIGCTLYTTLEPCAMCAGAIIHARIKRLVFGASDPKSGAAGSVLNIFKADGINHRVEVSSGILQKECGDLLTEFFRKKRENFGACDS